MARSMRVAFVLNAGGTHWMGGVNYMTNLLRAISASSRLEPVIFSPSLNISKEFEEFRNLEYHQSALVDHSSRAYLLRKSIARGLGRDIVFERYLLGHGVDVLSHYGHLGSRSTLATVSWIPDFQHLHMPEFFDPQEVRSRNSMYRRVAKGASIILLSSENARRDIVTLHPWAKSRTRVLRFVSDVGAALANVLPREYLEREYGLIGPYFHVPNQFWIHKNHSVVIDALSLARRNGRPMTVVATGHTEDLRHPDYFAKLMQRAAAAGCQNDFRVLGLVPYDALASLMVHSSALINPSLFEGWSTTVEEAKSIGKRIILSDIPVHREQAPDYGTFFSASDPSALAGAMVRHLDTDCFDAESSRREKARTAFEWRFHAFANTYEDIVSEAATLRASK